MNEQKAPIQAQLKSNIDQVAAMRMIKMLGPQILQAFLGLETQIIEKGAISFFGQIGFNDPKDPLQEGALIPTIHLSLQPSQPVMESMFLEPSDEDTKD